MFLDDIVGPMSVIEARKSGADKWRQHFDKETAASREQFNKSTEHYNRLKTDPEYQEQQFQNWQKQVHGNKQINELFEPQIDYYTLSNGQLVQASYRPGPNLNALPGSVSIEFVDPKLKPQGGSFDSTGQASPWDRAPDGVKQEIMKFVKQQGQQQQAPVTPSQQVAQNQQQGVAEDAWHAGDNAWSSDKNQWSESMDVSEPSPVAGAITRRILMQRHDLLKQYGPELVGAAVDNVADYVGDVEEIGSSDVSAWVAQVERMLKDNPPEAFAEGQLDEIDRRGFLKGLGAAALAAVVPTVAKGQTIGGGEEEAKDAATKAGNLFLNLSKGAHREVAQWVSNTVYSRVLQYYNFGGQQINVVTDVAIKAAYQAVNGDFQMVYQAADKDKEDTSLAGTYLRNRLGNRFGVDAGGRDSQLKMAGSLERFNLAPIAEKFVKEYTRALQEALTYFKQQTKESVQQGVAEAVPAQASGVDPKIQFLQPTIQFAEKLGYQVTLNPNPNGKIFVKLVNKQIEHTVRIGFSRGRDPGTKLEADMSDNWDSQTYAWSAKELAQDFKEFYKDALRDSPTQGQQGVAEGQQPINRNAVIQKLEAIYTKLYKDEDPESYDLPAAVMYWHSLPADQLAMEFEDAIDRLKQSRGSIDEAQTDYSKRRQRERDVDAGKPVSRQAKNPQTDYARKRAKEKRDLERFGESTNYWTKLQDKRNTKLNSLVNELKESVK